MNGLVAWAGFLDLLLVVGFSLLILSRRREPAVTLAWIVAFFALPYIGVVLYVFFGYWGRRRRKRRKPHPLQRPLTPEAVQAVRLAVPETFHHVERLAGQLTSFSAVAGNRVDLLNEPEATYAAMEKAIRAARHHVHLEYYLFLSDEIGVRFGNLLAKRAREGIECRLLVDHVGSLWLNWGFIRRLRSEGVTVVFFSPMSFGRPWGMHLRNHRKLMVVDGSIGFIGSQNIGNEYRHWRRRQLEWRDCHLQVEGPVVEQLQTIFAEDWKFATQESLQKPEYFPALRAVGTSVTQALPTGPDKSEHSLSLVILSLLYASKHRITITTPYFIPNQAILLALESAARRGVRVQILLPHQSDHRLVLWAGRSWYTDLLENGVHLYETRRAFVHAKIVTVDSHVALVGSANMDTRSFLLNYESGLLIYDTGLARQLEEVFDQSLQSGQEMTVQQMRSLGIWEQLRQNAARVLSPLL